MKQLNKYYGDIKKLKKEFKNRKSKKYLMKKMDILLELLTNFPDDIYYYARCVYLDLTDGKCKYHFSDDMKYYFNIKNNKMLILNEDDIEQYITKEANLFIKKNVLYSAISIQDYGAIIRIINTFRKEYIMIYKIDTNKDFIKHKYFFRFSSKIQQICMLYIEILTSKNGTDYRELEEYCNRPYDFIKNYNGCIDDNNNTIFGVMSNYYIDGVVDLSDKIYIDEEVYSIDKKWNIRNLNKQNWDYYRFEFEYLRSVFNKCVSNEIIKVADALWDNVFNSFTMLIVFCATNGRCIVCETDFDRMNLEEKLDFYYWEEDFLDEESYSYQPKINLTRALFIRYMFYNMQYVYNEFIKNPNFSIKHKKILKDYMEFTLCNISEAFHYEKFYSIFNI